MIMISQKKRKNPDSPLVSGWPCCSVLSTSPFKTSKIPPRGLSYQVKADYVQPLQLCYKATGPKNLPKKSVCTAPAQQQQQPQTKLKLQCSKRIPSKD
jgi:hypothetical protein